MTEIKAEEVTINGHVALGDFIISGRELENLYAYLKENEQKREKDLKKAARKAKRLEKRQSRLCGYYRRMQERLEARNRDLDRLAGMLEEM